MKKQVLFTELLKGPCIGPPWSKEVKIKDIHFGDVFEVVGRSEPHNDKHFLIIFRRVHP